MPDNGDNDSEEITQPTEASRRTFLKGLGAVTAGGVIATMQGGVFGSGAYAAADSGNVIVVLSLRGGADGLSLVVPYSDRNYVTLRPTIGIPPSMLLQTNGTFGLHPNFAPLQQMWQSGRIAAIHGVGQPTANLSHFSAIAQMEEADPDSSVPVGWVNRLVGMLAPDALIGATQIGDSVPHTQLYGPQTTLSAGDIDNMQVFGPDGAMPERIAGLDVVWDQASGKLGQAGRDAISTAEVWAPVIQQPDGSQNGAVYPSGALGSSLAASARVIRSGAGVSVLTVDHPGWDMHAGLGTLSSGSMHGMIDELARAINAFFTDLGSLGDSVTLVTISEFGRRVQENGDAGLDHGWGNVMLLFGGGVKGGYYAREWQGLSPKGIPHGNLKVTTDYRSVLWALVNARFPDVSLPTLFPEFTPEKVGAMT